MLAYLIRNYLNILPPANETTNCISLVCFPSKVYLVINLVYNKEIYYYNYY